MLTYLLKLLAALIRLFRGLLWGCLLRGHLHAPFGLEEFYFVVLLLLNENSSVLGLAHSPTFLGKLLRVLGQNSIMGSH